MYTPASVNFSQVTGRNFLPGEIPQPKSLLRGAFQMQNSNMESIARAGTQQPDTFIHSLTAAAVSHVFRGAIKRDRTATNHNNNIRTFTGTISPTGREAGPAADRRKTSSSTTRAIPIDESSMLLNQTVSDICGI